ncbi:MAG: nuclear transport factor 2 family protein [Acidimicrobiia bacterium]|nr:nuclear transport factor 2 family protein [Acidimicrobiia bacterium]
MHPFRQGVESRDLEAMLATFSPDIVVHSPVLFKPFEGIETVRAVFEILVEVFEDLHYTDEMTDANGTTALVFEARVGDRSLQGIDLLRHNADGRVNDFTVFVRPQSGLLALGDAVGARLGDLRPT